jgi:heme-degrading monooxygenase HmoA
VVLEMAVLNVRVGQEPDFEAAFRKARSIIASSRGYIGHQLQRCLEKPGQYLLLVHWQNVEDHTQGFRQSEAYAEWKKQLHHFYDPFPTVEHYVEVS